MASASTAVQARRRFDRGEGLETHAYAFIHTDNIKTRIAELFGGDMQFDVIIGNPPYQLADGGRWHERDSRSTSCSWSRRRSSSRAILAMVIPSRWFAGGKGLDEFREAMLGDNRMRTLVDYPELHRRCFPGVDLEGGVCYFLWDRDNHGACAVTTDLQGRASSTANVARYSKRCDVFVRCNEALSILKKVAGSSKAGHRSLSLARRQAFRPGQSELRGFTRRTFRGTSAKSHEATFSVYQNGGTGYIAEIAVATEHAV